MNETEVLVPIEYKELYNPYWRYVVIEGGRNSGKSQNVAISKLIKGRKSKMRFLCTREVQKTIKDSVHKLLRDKIAEYHFDDYKITNESIVNLITGSEFIFKGIQDMNINDIKSMEGIDDCWVEEAHTMTKTSLDILIPTIRKPGSSITFTFNRFLELDPVYKMFVIDKPERTFHAHYNFDVMEKYGWVSRETKEQIEFDRVNNADIFAWKWLGEPLAQNEFSTISRTKILQAMNQQVADDGQIEIGVDVARMGGDRTVLWKRKGMRTVSYEIYTKKRTTEVCDLVESFAEFNKEIRVKVDDTGVGGGVTDELLKRGYKVIPINFGSEPFDKDKYPNLISEAWFYFESIVDQTQLPMNQDLLMELSSRQWKMDAKGKRCIESKNDYKKRGFPSPDLADACILAYYNKNSTADNWLELMKSQGGTQ